MALTSDSSSTLIPDLLKCYCLSLYRVILIVIPTFFSLPNIVQIVISTMPIFLEGSFFQKIDQNQSLAKAFHSIDFKHEQCYFNRYWFNTRQRPSLVVVQFVIEKCIDDNCDLAWGKDNCIFGNATHFLRAHKVLKLVSSIYL